MSGKKSRTEGSFSFPAVCSPAAPLPIPVDIPLPVELDPEFSDDPNLEGSRTTDENEELDAEKIRDVQANRNRNAVVSPNRLHLSTDTGALSQTVPFTLCSGTINASTTSRPLLRGSSWTSKLLDAPKTKQSFSSSPNSVTQSSVGGTSRVDVFGQLKGSGAALGKSALSSSPFGYGSAGQPARSGTSFGAPSPTPSLFGASTTGACSNGFLSHIETPHSMDIVNNAAPAPSHDIFMAPNLTKGGYSTPVSSTVPGTKPHWETNCYSGYKWRAPESGISHPGGFTATSMQDTLPKRAEPSITTDPFGESSFFERVSLMLKQDLADAAVFELCISSLPSSPTPLKSCAIEKRFHDDYSAASYALGASLFRKPQIALHPSPQNLARELNRYTTSSKSVLKTTLQAERIRNIKQLVVID